MDTKAAWAGFQLLGSSGVLFESQALQLKLWPHLVYPNLKKFELVYDPETETIEYHVVLKFFSKTPKNVQSRLNALDLSVKSLLGPQWRVVVKVKGRTVYERLGLKKFGDPNVKQF